MGSQSPDSNFLGVAKSLYGVAQPHLQRVPHFGLLDEGLFINSTRADYVEEHARILMDLKRDVFCTGLGVGGYIQNKVGLLSKNTTGLDICQSWAVLLNLGHLFGTFATERCLLFVLDRNLVDRNAFVEGCIRKVRSEQDELRRAINDCLDNGDLYRLHYFLAMWRISQSESEFDEKQAASALELIKVFVCSPLEKIKRLGAIFKKTRKLAYLQLHSKIPHNKHKLGGLDRSDYIELFPQGEIGGSNWISDARWKLIEQIDLHDNEKFFGSNEAAASILSHIKAFEVWWRDINSSKGLQEKLSQLFSRPIDWPAEKSVHLQHYLQLRLPTSLGWMNEVRLWYSDSHRRDKSLWEDLEFIITPTLADQVAKINIYSADGAKISAALFEHMALQLERSFSSNFESDEARSLWAGTANLMVKILAGKINSNYSIRVTPTKASGYHAGFACAGRYEFCRANLKKFLPHATDPQRVIELRQLISICDKVLGGTAGWRTPSMLMFATAEVISNSQETAEISGEFDGLAIFAEKEEVKILMVESKKKNSACGQGQLRGLVMNLFGASPDINAQSFDNQSSWYCIV